MPNEPSELTVHLDDLRGWETLTKKNRKEIWDRTLTVLEALHGEQTSKIQIGQQLSEVRKILVLRRMWIAYLSKNFRMSNATAYRYINAYEKPLKQLPPVVLSIAMRRGYRPQQMERIIAHPPPKTDNQIVIGRHLDKLEMMPREVREEVIDTDLFLKESVNYVGARFDKILTAKHRVVWVRALFGMLLTRFGFGASQSFDPMAIPHEFRLPKGRPPQAKVATIH